jgi:hypothetical protein
LKRAGVEDLAGSARRTIGLGSSFYELHALAACLAARVRVTAKAGRTIGHGSGSFWQLQRLDHGFSGEKVLASAVDVGLDDDFSFCRMDFFRRFSCSWLWR